MDPKIIAQEASHMLEKGEFILLPTDVYWSIGLRLDDIEMLPRLQAITPTEALNLAVLVDSLERLNYYVAPIHPRIENLLFFHKRPLTVFFPNPRHVPPVILRKDKTAAFRIVQDTFCRLLIETCDNPLIVLRAAFPHDPDPVTLDQVPAEFQQLAAFTVPRQFEVRPEQMPDIRVSFNKKGDLKFL